MLEMNGDSLIQESKIPIGEDQRMIARILRTPWDLNGQPIDDEMYCTSLEDSLL